MSIANDVPGYQILIDEVYVAFRRWGFAGWHRGGKLISGFILFYFGFRKSVPCSIAFIKRLVAHKRRDRSISQFAHLLLLFVICV